MLNGPSGNYRIVSLVTRNNDDSDSEEDLRAQLKEKPKIAQVAFFSQPFDPRSRNFGRKRVIVMVGGSRRARSQVTAGARVVMFYS